MNRCCGKFRRERTLYVKVLSRRLLTVKQHQKVMRCRKLTDEDSNRIICTINDFILSDAFDFLRSSALAEHLRLFTEMMEDELNIKNADSQLSIATFSSDSDERLNSANSTSPSPATNSTLSSSADNSTSPSPTTNSTLSSAANSTSSSSPAKSLTDSECKSSINSPSPSNSETSEKLSDSPCNSPLPDALYAYFEEPQNKNQLAKIFSSTMNQYFHRLKIHDKEIELAKLIFIVGIPRKIFKRNDMYHFQFMV